MKFEECEGELNEGKVVMIHLKSLGMSPAPLRRLKRAGGAEGAPAPAPHSTVTAI